MNKQIKILVVRVTTAILIAAAISACGRMGNVDPSQAPSMQDPVARFPDEPVVAVDDNGNWLNPPPPPAPEPPPPPVASYSYSGTGN